MFVRRMLDSRKLVLFAATGVLLAISACNLGLSQLANLAYFVVDSALWSIS